MGFVVESGDVSAEEHIGHGDEWVVRGEWFDGEDIESCGADFSGLESADEGGFIDERSAGGVNDHDAGFHAGDAVIIDHVSSFGGDGEVQGDEIGL
jgi:hypothetical protein